MNDFEIEKGAIWQIFYYESMPVDVPENEQQAFLDNYSRETGGMFNPPPGLSPGEYSEMFVSHFLKTRKAARELIEKGSEKLIRVRDSFQVGDAESISELSKIQNDPKFHSWENPSIVEYFRNISNMHL
jgi:hypothetical protein